MLEACLDERRASAFVAGDLPPVLRESIEDHVDDCGSCRQLLAALVRSDESGTWTLGQRVGRYIVGDRIGRGGMGVVFRADDVELGRAVALKRLDASFDHAVLLREARAAAQLSHPNVVAVYEVGEADGAPFLAMELVEGTTLTRWLCDERRSWPEIVDVLVQAGRGLAAAHARGLVHRDFKPDNVLVDHSTPRARVADFGLARVAPVAIAGDALVTTTSLAGTPAYLAPELVDGAAPDARSDQFALGVTAFEALYGAHPYAGTTAEAMWAQMSAGAIREVRGRRVPAWLDRCVRRALAVEPDARWPSVTAFVDAMVRGMRPAMRRWPYVAGAFAIANIAIAGWLLAPASSTDPCGDAVAHVDRTWNVVTRQASTLRLTSVAPARGDTIASAVQLVDDWSAAWRIGARAACHADTAQRVVRLGCLERGLGELRAQLAAWQAPDRGTIDHAASAIAALPQPDVCAAHPPPLATAPAELVGRVERVNALEREGKPREAKPLLAKLVVDATASKDAVTLGRALAATGIIERELGDLPHAREHDAAAAREAARAGDDDVTLRALVEEAQSAIDSGHPGEAIGLCDAADALVAREHLGREDRLAVTRGDALKALGRTPEAIEQYRRAIAVLEPRALRDRADRIALASVLGATGSALGQQFKLEEAHAMLARGLAIEELELGRDHPEVGKTLHDLANQEVPLARLDDAAAHYQRARAIFAARFGERTEFVGGSDLGLGSVERARGHYPEARRYYERARVAMQASLPAGHPTFALIEENLANTDRDEDKNQSALEHLTAAIAIREKAGLVGSELADDHVGLATVLFELDRAADARTHAERGLALLDGLDSNAQDHVNAWLVLSELESDAGHRARALELAHEILAALGDDPRADWAQLRKREQDRVAEWTRSGR